MKKKKAAIIIFIIVLVFPMVSWPFLSQVKDVEVNENRELAEFPDFDNNVIVNFDRFFTDHVPFRGAYIMFYSMFNTSLNKAYMQIIEGLTPKQPTPPVTPPEESPNTPPEPDDPENPETPVEPVAPEKDELELIYEQLSKPRPERPTFIEQNAVVLGKDDWLFFYGQDSLEYYLGTNIPTEEELQQMVTKAEKINNYFKSLGKDFVIYVAPNKEQIYFEYMMGGTEFSKLPKRWDVIAAYFRKYSDVKVVYPKKEILAAKEQFAKEQKRIYFKYDTHWNAAGGYFGAVELLKALDITPSGATFTPYVKDEFDLLQMLPAPRADDYDYEVTYRPDIYGEVFSDNAHYPTFICDGNNPNGKTLFILGDSFRENMLPILAKEYAKVYGYHRTMFNRESDAKCYDFELSQADAVVFQAVERVGDEIFDVIDRYCEAYGIE